MHAHVMTHGGETFSYSNHSEKRNRPCMNPPSAILMSFADGHEGDGLHATGATVRRTDFGLSMEWYAPALQLGMPWLTAHVFLHSHTGRNVLASPMSTAPDDRNNA